MKNIAVITSGYLPVPPTKGGAVENLLFNVIKKNEIFKRCKFTIFSIFDKNDKINLKYSNVIYIKTSFLSKILDYCLYFFAKNILRKEHLISYRYFFQRIEFYKKVGINLLNNDYDKVLLENNVVMFKSLLYKNNFSKYLGKIYYHAHNELGVTLGYEKYLKRIKKIISVSDYISNYYKNILHSDNIKYSVVHNCVDEELFCRPFSVEEQTNLKISLGLNISYPVLLFSGRLSKEKGIKELLESLSKINTSNYNLLILGKTFYNADIIDPFEKKLKEIANNVKGNIVFTGQIAYSDMYKYYKISDICILPSIWNEPCSLAVIETIVSGVPLITTDTGGTLENITDSTIVISVHDIVNNLCKKIEILINNFDKLKLLKESCKKEIYKHGTLNSYYHLFVDELDL